MRLQLIISRSRRRPAWSGRGAAPPCPCEHLRRLCMFGSSRVKGAGEGGRGFECILQAWPPCHSGAPEVPLLIPYEIQQQVLFLPGLVHLPFLLSSLSSASSASASPLVLSAASLTSASASAPSSETSAPVRILAEEVSPSPHHISASSAPITSASPAPASASSSAPSTSTPITSPPSAMSSTSCSAVPSAEVSQLWSQLCRNTSALPAAKS